MGARRVHYGMLPVAVLAAALLVAGCRGSTAAPEAPAAATQAEPSGAAVDAGFPTGPAVVVGADFTPPSDRVDSTGAYLPANGKPTLVFVDAIW